MATVPPAFRADLARLAHLPRRAGHVLLGSLRPLDCMLFAPGQTIQPWLALWIDEHTHSIRGAQLINPHASTTAGRGEALGALVHALGTSVIPPSKPRTRRHLATPDVTALPLAADAGGGLDTHPATCEQCARPGLPERVYADDRVLARMAGELLRPLRIPVEFRAHLSEVDSFFTSLTGFLASIEPPQPDHASGHSLQQHSLRVLLPGNGEEQSGR